MTRICLACNARGCQHTVSRITPREEAILKHFLDAPPLSHKQLAYILQMAEGTLKEHLRGIYRKLGFGGAGSAVQTILWAHDHRELLGS